MDLRDSLQSWEATEGVLLAQEQLSRPTCFKCGKLEHRAADCYTGTTTSHESSMKDERAIISCFACGQPGHKSPDCPNKADSKLKKKVIARRRTAGKLYTTTEFLYHWKIPTSFRPRLKERNYHSCLTLVPRYW